MPKRPKYALWAPMRKVTLLDNSVTVTQVTMFAMFIVRAMDDLFMPTVEAYWGSCYRLQLFIGAYRYVKVIDGNSIRHGYFNSLYNWSMKSSICCFVGVNRCASI